MSGSQGHCTRLPCTRSNLTSGPSAGPCHSQSNNMLFSIPSSYAPRRKWKFGTTKLPLWCTTCTHNPIAGVIQNAGPTVRLTAGQPRYRELGALSLCPAITGQRQSRLLRVPWTPYHGWNLPFRDMGYHVQTLADRRTCGVLQNVIILVLATNGQWITS